MIGSSMTRIGWFKNSSLSLHGYGLVIKIKSDGNQDSVEGLFENTDFEESTFTRKRKTIQTYDGVNDFIAQEIEWPDYIINVEQMESIKND